MDAKVMTSIQTDTDTALAFNPKSDPTLKSQVKTENIGVYIIV